MRLPLGVALAVPVLWASILPATRMGGAAPPGPVFSVALLREHLTTSPHSWVGRVVSVRAVAWGCWALGGPGTAKCRIWRPGLIDQPGQTAALPLRWAAPSPLLLTLHRLPLLGELVPVQVTRWDMPAIYHIQLQAAPCLMPSRRSCYAAVLLDAVPTTG
jgi:hypothetical protein